MAENPEKPAETAPPAAAAAEPNDAASTKPENAPDPDAVLVVEEIAAEELEQVAAEVHPTFIRSPSIKELLESQDPPSRFMTFLSIAFGLLAIVCITTLVMKYLQARKAGHALVLEEPKPLPEKIITESLGEIRLILKGADSPNDGELRVDVVAECTTQEACDYLKANQIRARDIVIPVLVNVRREEILNPDSKDLIRRRIAEQLNSMPMNGKIIQILFTDLTVEDAPDH